MPECQPCNMHLQLLILCVALLEAAVHTVAEATTKTPDSDDAETNVHNGAGQPKIFHHFISDHLKRETSNSKNPISKTLGSNNSTKIFPNGTEPTASHQLGSQSLNRPINPSEGLKTPTYATSTGRSGIVPKSIESAIGKPHNSSHDLKSAEYPPAVPKIPSLNEDARKGNSTDAKGNGTRILPNGTREPRAPHQLGTQSHINPSADQKTPPYATSTGRSGIVPNIIEPTIGKQDSSSHDLKSAEYPPAIPRNLSAREDTRRGNSTDAKGNGTRILPNGTATPRVPNQLGTQSLQSPVNSSGDPHSPPHATGANNSNGIENARYPPAVPRNSSADEAQRKENSKDAKVKGTRILPVIGEPRLPHHLETEIEESPVDPKAPPYAAGTGRSGIVPNSIKSPNASNNSDEKSNKYPPAVPRNLPAAEDSRAGHSVGRLFPNDSGAPYQLATQNVKSPINSSGPKTLPYAIGANNTRNRIVIVDPNTTGSLNTSYNLRLNDPGNQTSPQHPKAEDQRRKGHSPEPDGTNSTFSPKITHHSGDKALNSPVNRTARPRASLLYNPYGNPLHGIQDSLELAKKALESSSTGLGRNATRIVDVREERVHFFNDRKQQNTRGQPHSPKYAPDNRVNSSDPTKNMPVIGTRNIKRTIFIYTPDEPKKTVNTYGSSPHTNKDFKPSGIQDPYKDFNNILPPSTTKDHFNKTYPLSPGISICSSGTGHPPAKRGPRCTVNIFVINNSKRNKHPFNTGFIGKKYPYRIRDTKPKKTNFEDHPSKIKDFEVYPYKRKDFERYPSKIKDFEVYPSKIKDYEGYPSKIKDSEGYPSKIKDFEGYPSKIKDFESYPDKRKGFKDDPGKRKESSSNSTRDVLKNVWGPIQWRPTTESTEFSRFEELFTVPTTSTTIKPEPTTRKTPTPTSKAPTTTTHRTTTTFYKRTTTYKPWTTKRRYTIERRYTIKRRYRTKRRYTTTRRYSYTSRPRRTYRPRPRITIDRWRVSETKSWRKPSIQVKRVLRIRTPRIRVRSRTRIRIKPRRSWGIPRVHVRSKISVQVRNNRVRIRSKLKVHVSGRRKR